MVRAPKKFLAVYGQVRQEILSGELAVGYKMPNERELAQRFDCSLGTVSKALALLAHEGLVSRRARAGTTVISGSLSPQPSQKQLDAFAFIYPSEQHDGIWRIVRGFQSAAQKAGRRSVLLSTGVDYQKEAEFLGRLSEFDVCGAAIYPLIPTPQDQVHFSQILLNSKFPLVLVDDSLHGIGCSSVTADGFHAGYTMARHMISRGAKHIGFLCNHASSLQVRDRHQGYLWALEEAGIPAPPRGVFFKSAMHLDFSAPIAEPTAIAEAYLQAADRLDAVVCSDDYMALGCIAAALKLGRKIPGDLLVSGIDDLNPQSPSAGVPLTTYRVPFEDMGQKAFDALLSGSRKNTGDSSATHLRGTLVIRESA